MNVPERELGKAGKLVYQKKECCHLVVTTSVKQEHGCDWPYQQFWAPLCVKGVACVSKPTIEGVKIMYMTGIPVHLILNTI